MADAAPVRCPPRLPGPHVGFEQVGPVPAAHWLLWGMRLFDVAPGATPTGRPPDNVAHNHDVVTETWRVLGHEPLLMMVCLYNGAGTYYQARLSPPPARCVLHDDNGLTMAWCE